MRRYTLVCDEPTAERVEQLAVEFGLTEQEVIQQLVDVGLEEIERERSRERV